MDWLIWGVIGWCGTRWPWHFWGGGGGDPEPWPPNCPACGRIFGALAAILVVRLAGGAVAGSGFLATTVVALAAGKVGYDLVGSAVRMMRGK